MHLVTYFSEISQELQYLRTAIKHWHLSRSTRAKEMAPQLWALVALLENHGFIRSIYMVAAIFSMNQTLSFHFCGHCMRVVQRHAVKTHIHITK